MADPVDAAAELLYGLPLDEFTVARNAAAKELRDRGLRGGGGRRQGAREAERRRLGRQPADATAARRPGRVPRSGGRRARRAARGRSRPARGDRPPAARARDAGRGSARGAGRRCLRGRDGSHPPDARGGRGRRRRGRGRPAGAAGEGARAGRVRDPRRARKARPRRRAGHGARRAPPTAGRRSPRPGRGCARPRTSTARRSPRSVRRTSAGSRRSTTPSRRPDGSTGPAPHSTPFARDEDRGLRPHRRPADGRARRARRLDRLVLLPPLRLGRVLRSAPRHAGQRPLAARAGGRDPQVDATLPPRHARPRVGLRDRRRLGAGDRLHAAARRRARHRPHRRGARRRGADALGARDPLRLRLDRALGAPRRRRPCRRRRPGRALLPHARRNARRGHDHRLGVRPAAGRPGPVRAHVVSLARRSPRRDRPGAGARRRRGLLARVGVGVRPQRSATTTRSTSRCSS